MILVLSDLIQHCLQFKALHCHLYWPCPVQVQLKLGHAGTGSDPLIPTDGQRGRREDHIH